MTVPFFTVIMATWGRGRHILPSITSVLQQDFADFELLVVGDACTDETEAVVTGITDVRVRWRNLTTRCGSQSAPNNAGIAAARGKVIAYLGHDDIWEPNHLAELARVFAGPGAPDFGVSGLIGHPPSGVQGCVVKGLFDQDSAKHRHFFPPSSFAHRKDVVDRIGLWRMPKELRAPVDVDLLLRARAADLRFRSTGVVTVHKFEAALRYLSYVQQDSEEQDTMLSDLGIPEHAARIAKIVEDSKVTGRYMLESLQSYDHQVPGNLARMSSERRGILVPVVRPLGAGAVIRQRPEDCGLDWQNRPRFGIRLNTRNPRPRFLVPFLASGPVVLTIRAVHPDRKAFGPLDLLCNGVAVTAQPIGLRPSLWGWSACYEALIDLRQDLPSVLEFRLDPRQQKKRKHWRSRFGFGIGKLWLTPKIS